VKHLAEGEAADAGADDENVLVRRRHDCERSPSPPFERRLTLLDEGGHAFEVILGRGRRGEAFGLAMGMLVRGRARLGEELFAWSNNAFRPIRVVDPRRFDPQGAKLNG